MAKGIKNRQVLAGLAHKHREEQKKSDKHNKSKRKVRSKTRR